METKKLALFESLYLQGASVHPPGAPLAALIYRCGKPDLIEKILNAGADINASSGDNLPAGDLVVFRLTSLQAAAIRGNLDLTYDLVNRGAKVNAPAHHINGKTALQAICGWPAVSIEEQKRKFELARFLINKDADVNGVPAGEGETALQAAIRCGDLDIVLLLLCHQAAVNENASSRTRYSALDHAALYGRIDIVKLLLNHNALSYQPGLTGYDGAIDLARQVGHHTIVDVIHKHAIDNQKI